MMFFVTKKNCLAMLDKEMAKLNKSKFKKANELTWKGLLFKAYQDGAKTEQSTAQDEATVQLEKTVMMLPDFVAI